MRKLPEAPTWESYISEQSFRSPQENMDWDSRLIYRMHRSKTSPLKRYFRIYTWPQRGIKIQSVDHQQQTRGKKTVKGGFVKSLADFTDALDRLAAWG